MQRTFPARVINSLFLVETINLQFYEKKSIKKTAFFENCGYAMWYEQKCMVVGAIYDV